MFSVLKMSGVRLKILPEHKNVDIIRNMQGEYMTEAGNNYSEKKTQLHISVRNLVEFIFREGDIDNRSSRAMSADAMMEGTRIHRKIQGSMGKEYQAEVPLSLVVEGDLYELTVEGRADGIFTENGKCFVDEIKGMYRRVELFEKPVFVHRAQAMCYAYIFALQNNMETIGIQMTYCNLETEQTKYFREEFSFEEIKKWFDDLMEEYGKWATFRCEMKNQRQAGRKLPIQNVSYQQPRGCKNCKSGFLCLTQPAFTRRPWRGNASPVLPCTCAAVYLLQFQQPLSSFVQTHWMGNFLPACSLTL